MKSIKLILLVIISSVYCYGEAINIDVGVLDKIPAPKLQKQDTVVEIVPVKTIPNTNPVQTNFQKHVSQDASINIRSNYQYNIDPREASRESFIKALREVVEKGKEFKYFFPNFDYTACKKEIDQMLRDSVSQ